MINVMLSPLSRMRPENIVRIDDFYVLLQGRFPLGGILRAKQHELCACTILAENDASARKITPSGKQATD